MEYTKDRKIEHCIWLIYMELFFELDVQIWHTEKPSPIEFKRRCQELENIIILTCIEYDIDTYSIIEYTSRYGRPYNYSRAFYNGAVKDEISRFMVINKEMYESVLKCISNKREELEHYQNIVLKKVISSKYKGWGLE